MASIFATYFEENERRLKRISHGKHQPSASPNTTIEPESRNFANVLSDIERRDVENRTTASREYVYDGITSERPLSNLSEVEQERLKLNPLPLSEPRSGACLWGLATKDYEGEAQQISLVTDETSVNIPLVVVKELPRQAQGVSPLHNIGNTVGTDAPQSIDDQSTPDTPIIVRARRLKSAVVAQRYSANEVRDIVATAGKFHGIAPDLSLAVAHAESSMRVDAVSKDGFHTKGIFQLRDSTGRGMLDYFRVNENYDPFDPGLNSYLGVGYLKRLHEIFSRETILAGNIKTIPAKSASNLEKLALAAFNAGEGAVALAQSKVKEIGQDPSDYNHVKAHLPATTQTYVDRVTRLRASINRSEDSRYTG